MNYDKIIYKIIVPNKKGIDNNKLELIKTSYPNIYNYLYNRFDDSYSFDETLLRFKYINNFYYDLSDSERELIEHKPKCKNHNCNNPVHFIGKKNKMFGIYCSNSCRSKEINGKLWKEGQEKYNLKHYGIKCNWELNNVKEKRKETLINKYGDSKFNNIEKRKKTCFEKYGVDSYTLTPQYKLSSYLSRKNNTTFNCSKQEDLSYYLLKKFYKDILRNYKSDVYPYSCDFYIPSKDLYIECNYHWTHNDHFYDENNIDDINIINEWKSKNTKYYDNAINTWSIRDKEKYETSIKNNLNYIVFWDILDLLKFLNYECIYYNEKQLNEEFNYFKNEKIIELNGISRRNKIIKFFQQDTFFKIEQELLKDKEIKNKLINNRIKYLNKTEFNYDELLGGFKRSGIYYGYSHFNPLLFKWFIEKYNVKTCYDPCGGWGHRLLGAQDLDLYIYNDLSTSVYNNVNNIIDYFNINNTVTYNNDARCFNPSENYEAIFTCPPYFNIEKYECESFKDINDYNDFIDCLFNNFYNSNAKIFGLVIREDLLSNKYKWNERYEICTNDSHLRKKNNKEYIYMFF